MSDTSKNSTVPDVELEGVRFTQTEGGDTLWYLTADSAVMLQGGAAAMLLGISVEFIEKTGERVTVTGNSGKLDIKSKNFMLEGNIVAKSSDGTLLRTEKLFWSADKKVMETKTPVEIVRAGTTIRCNELRASSNLEMVWGFAGVETIVK